jgi:CheY-like chemotaxis protein
MRTNRKILVVDDDAVVGKSFDRVLSGKGYAVITAHDGTEALDKLGKGNYDLVFTDIKMPGMSGLEMAERIKASRPWLPVVIITGYGTEANEERAKAAGVRGFLHKPLSPEMIEASAEQALLEREATPGSDGAAVVAAPASAPAAVPVGRGRTAARAAANVALFFAAPFIGLAYILALPFVGLGLLAWMGGKALMERERVRKFAAAAGTAGMMVVGPFVGLAYILALPFVGLAALAWIGARALLRLPA